MGWQYYNDICYYVMLESGIICTKPNDFPEKQKRRIMIIEEVKKGDINKQGNAECPQCGERVLIKQHWGDIPKCNKCDIPYKIKHPPIRFEY